MEELLNVVNENDEVIGVETREKIHQEGLLHREVSVYFITPDREIIFQRRSKNKSACPDLLGAAVAGHVAAGETYEKTAEREALEETSILINKDDLILVRKDRASQPRSIGKKENNIFRSRYLYVYRGQINDLKIEDNEGAGFESWPIKNLMNMSDIDKLKFVPSTIKFVTEELIEFIKDLKFQF
ncbi:MAG: NUDIX domain-containing protein [Patescibacteria group bacterium]